MQNKLLQICNKNDMTLQELGIKLGKSKQYMSELNRGNIRLTYQMAIEIAKVFNTTPDKIFLSKEYNRATCKGGEE